MGGRGIVETEVVNRVAVAEESALESAAAGHRTNGFPELAVQVQIGAQAE